MRDKFLLKKILWTLSRYNDSPDGDWVIGKHPSDDSIILATAGSGHAYKVFQLALESIIMK